MYLGLLLDAQLLRDPYLFVHARGLHLLLLCIQREGGVVWSKPKKKATGGFDVRVTPGTDVPFDLFRLAVVRE